MGCDCDLPYAFCGDDPGDKSKVVDWDVNSEIESLLLFTDAPAQPRTGSQRYSPTMMKSSRTCRYIAISLRDPRLLLESPGEDVGEWALGSFCSLELSN